MYKDKKIGVAIPCYMSGIIAVKVIEDVLNYVDLVVLIDDKCPKSTGNLVEKSIKSEKLKVIYNLNNLGVGGATKKGFKYLLENNCDVIIKLDSDGQMNVADIPAMYVPIVNNICEATKGNRFTSMENIKNIPKIRLFGNICLGFITKLSTGYWDLFDPTNGFIAFNSSILKIIDLTKVDNRFFFETDLLFRCGLKNIRIKNIETECIYNNLYSSLKPLKELPNFFKRHIKLIIKRLLYQYFILDFNPGSIELILSFAFGLISFVLGFLFVYKSSISGIFTSAGNVSLFTISSIISIQLFSNFIYYDCTTRIMNRERN